MAGHSPLDQNDELAGKYFLDVYRRRFEKYGPHPRCSGCLKVNMCMVPNVPGYEFECNERAESASDMIGVSPVCSRKPKKGEW